MNPNIKAALSYLDRGWSVIPINPTNKRSLIKWKPFTARRPTKDEVETWFTTWPKASVGIVTGSVSKLVVVDVDPDRGGDADEWSKQQPSDLQSATRRGGTHFYYGLNGAGKVRNSVDRLATGVDVRGEGGYVVAPPSAGYKWRRGGPNEHQVLPDFNHQNDDSEQDDSRLSKEPWLERTLRGVGHGERNDACARLAGYYVKQKIPVDVIVAQLSAWNQLNDPPLPESEIRTTVESVARTAVDNRERGTYAFRLEDDTGTDAGGSSLYDITDLSSYLSKYGSEPVSWLIKDWLPEQTVGMVVAPPGSYKTWLLQDLAVSIATGLPFLGQFPVLKCGPVLFMQQEDWHGQTAHRFSLIVARRAGLTIPRMVGDTLHVHYPPRVPIYLHEQRRFRFNDKSVVDAWIEKISSLRPSLVILDPLYSAGSVDDFMAGTAGDMFLFKSVRDTLGTTFMIAHHTRKASSLKNGDRRTETSPEREDVWGSQFLNAWIETGWQIRKREELGTASITRHFKVQSDAAQAVLGFNIDTTQIPGKYEVSVKEVKPGDKDEGADLIALLEQRGECTMAQLAQFSGMHRATVFRRMKNLLSAGVVSLNKGLYSVKDGPLDA